MYISNLGQLTNEFKRDNVGTQQQIDSEESEEELQVLTSEDILKERQRIAKIVKKGVGYNWVANGGNAGKLDSKQYL